MLARSQTAEIPSVPNQPRLCVGGTADKPHISSPFPPRSVGTRAGPLAIDGIARWKRARSKRHEDADDGVMLRTGSAAEKSSLTVVCWTQKLLACVRINIPGMLRNSEAPHVPDGCATAPPSHLASRRCCGRAYPNPFVGRLPRLRARHVDRARYVAIQKCFEC